MSTGTSKQTLWRRNWFTVSSLVGRDFKRKYRRSALGVVWSVLNPLLMMCVLTAVFSAFFRFDIEYYPVYLILGNTLFAYMSESTSTAMNSIIDSASLIKKIRINKFIFPVEKVLFQLVNFMLSFIAVLVVMLFFRITPTINWVFFPLLIFFVTIFNTGLGLLLASLSVFFRDITHLWGVFLTAWTYATPLFYPANILPDWMLSIETFNPMYQFVTYYRDIALWGNTPSLETNIICAAVAFVTLAVGIVVFKSTQDRFILYV